MVIRPEIAEDEACIGAVISAAFGNALHSDGNEAAIVERLRQDGQLTVSFVAVIGGKTVGHIAFSPVRIGGETGDWFGLAPLSVHPRFQRRGIGAALVREGLGQLRMIRAGGCVVLGDPEYYGRFGFESVSTLTYCGESSPFFQSLTMRGEAPTGDVEYHGVFSEI